MDQRNFIFTSESVTEGHPDKMADQISDAILDAVLAKDPTGRVACETLLTTGLIVVAGEFTTKAQINIPSIVRETVKGIGYTDSAMGFDSDNCAVITAVGTQSPDIAMGVNATEEKEQGAGDQGLMFGYAINETPEFMPIPIMYSHKLAHRLSELRKNGRLPFLRPDGKTQVTVRYEDGKAVAIDAVVVSTQHSPDIENNEIKEAVMEEIIKPVIPRELLSSKTKYYVNPTGRFVIGGPKGDTGLTGRKIIMDTYGGWGRHGGGAFSGKDPSKVDRSASYMARYIAKNIVKSGLCTQCEVQIAYAIGVAEPVSVMVDTFGTCTVPEDLISKAVREVFNLKPAGIIKTLQLLRPIYQKTASYGHFGRSDKDFTWEHPDKAEQLRNAIG